MTNVIQFPIKRRPIRLADPPTPLPEVPRMGKIVAVVWTITVLLWTVARFILPMVVFWQFLRMVWFWDTPGRHEGLWFLAYFVGYSALYWFVGVYRPKGFEEPRQPSRGGRNGR